MSSHGQEQFGPVTRGKTQVPASKLGSELERIRREAAALDAEQEVSKGGEAAPRVRATLCNLMFLVSSGGPSVQSREVDTLLTDLCVAHPSRFFIVGFQPNTGEDSESLPTAASSRCVLTNAGMHVCSEEVYVDAQPDSVALVPNLLLSLLIPDIEVVLLLLSDPAVQVSDSTGANDPKAFQQLLSGMKGVCDLLLYDSMLFEDYASSVEVIYASRRNGHSEPAPSWDLNWNRTKRWRTLIAEQFDTTESVKSAENVRRVEVKCYSTEEEFERGKLSSEALLLGAWVLTCLGYEPKSVTKQEKDMVSLSAEGEGSFELSFVRREPDEADEASFLSDANVRSVSFELESELGQCHLKLARNVSESLAEISTAFSSTASGSSNTCDIFMRKVPFPKQTATDIVLADIGGHAEDEQYERSLSVSRSIASLVRT